MFFVRHCPGQEEISEDQLRSGLSDGDSGVTWTPKVSRITTLPIGPKVVPFWGSYLEFYKVIPKRNYFGAYGYRCWRLFYLLCRG